MLCSFMWKYCVYENSDKIFVYIPKESERHKLWLHSINRSYSKSSHLICCEDHFNLKEHLHPMETRPDSQKKRKRRTYGVPSPQKNIVKQLFEDDHETISSCRGILQEHGIEGVVYHSEAIPSCSSIQQASKYFASVGVQANIQMSSVRSQDITDSELERTSDTSEFSAAVISVRSTSGSSLLKYRDGNKDRDIFHNTLMKIRTHFSN